MELSSLNEMNVIVLIKETNDIDEINNFFTNTYWNKIGIFVKRMRKVSMRWKNWSDFQDLLSVQFQEEDWSKIETLSLNSQVRSRNYRMKSNCMNGSRDFQDAASVRSGQSHVARQPVFFPPHLVPSECWAVLWECRAATMGRQVFGTHMVHRETFLQIQRRLLQHLFRKSQILGVVLMYQNTHHHMWWVKAKHQFRIRDASQDCQREIQSFLVREILQRIMVQTNNDCRFLISILTSSLHQQPLLAGRQGSRPRYVLVTISHGNYAVHQRSGDGWFSGWIKFFVIYTGYFNAEFWSTRCEDCFSTEQNHP